MKIIRVEPGRVPFLKEIEPTLEALQSEVGGYIEPIDYPDGVTVLCNEEGKILNLEPCRALRDGHGALLDIIAGTFIIVGRSGEKFASIPEDQIEKYLTLFRAPEKIIKLGDTLLVVRMHAGEEAKENE